MKKNSVIYEDFSKLDFRVGEVLEVEVLENSRKLFSLTVDLGEDYGKVEILSGLREFVEIDDLRGKKFLFLANLEPKQMAGRNSNGMLIAGDSEGVPTLLPLDSKLANGTRIC